MRLSNFIKNFADIILPRFCLHCKSKLTLMENTLCKECFSRINFASKERMQYEFQRKFAEHKIISDFQSLFLFEVTSPIKTVLHELKYEKKFMIGKYVGSLINDYLAEEIFNWKADYIIPVPLHKLKKAQRGYNQSEFIAKEISKLLNVKLKTNLIKRVKYTETQTSMNLTERRENMKDAFVLNSKIDLKNKRIIILDDVITTGATIEACGKILKEKGAAEVFALSAALTD